MVPLFVGIGTAFFSALILPPDRPNPVSQFAWLTVRRLFQQVGRGKGCQSAIRADTRVMEPPGKGRADAFDQTEIICHRWRAGCRTARRFPRHGNFLFLLTTLVSGKKHKFNCVQEYIQFQFRVVEGCRFTETPTGSSLRQNQWVSSKNLLVTDRIEGSGLPSNQPSDLADLHCLCMSKSQPACRRRLD